MHIVALFNRAYESDRRMAAGALRTFAKSPSTELRLLDLRYREIMGRTLHEEWDRLRIDEAKHLLAGGLPVDSVSERCGFGTAVAFRAAFRRHCGVTPGDWTVHHE